MSNLPKLRKKGLDSKKQPTNGQTSFKMQDCMSHANFDLMNRLRNCKKQLEVTSLLTVFKANGYNRVAFNK